MRSLLRCTSAPWYVDCLQCHEGDSCVSHVMRQFCQEVLWQQYQECPPYLLHTDSFSFCKLQNSASCLCIHFRHLLTSLKHVFIVLLPLKWFAGLISFNFNCLCANDYQKKITNPSVSIQMVIPRFSLTLSLLSLSVPCWRHDLETIISHILSVYAIVSMCCPFFKSLYFFQINNRRRMATDNNRVHGR